MTIHKKLNAARIELQNTSLKKTGHNKFANYTYFELGDFLPTVNTIFNNHGLCGVISFTNELATLTITDIDDSTNIQITSPMKDANLKGCHPIQNLGAVQTYTRRYLWVTALEIVEHDSLDSSQPVAESGTDIKQMLVELNKATSMKLLNSAYNKAMTQCNGKKELQEQVRRRATEIKSLFAGDK
tara:strand:+ start:2722 stop:3276 length:555 start_codon:yes stop_codon:yes gene_type:complete